MANVKVLILSSGQFKQIGSSDTIPFDNLDIVSGTNIKTINGASILGAGNLAVSAALNTLTSATGSNIIANVANAQVWNWNLNGTANNAFTFADTGTTGTGYLVSINNAAGSSVNPFRVLARTNNAITVTAGGITTIGCSTTQTANTVVTTVTNGNGNTGLYINQSGGNPGASNITLITPAILTMSAIGGNVIAKPNNSATPVLTLSVPNNSTVAPIFLTFSNAVTLNNGGIGSTLSLYSSAGTLQGHIVTLTGLGTNECLRVSATGGANNYALLATAGRVGIGTATPLSLFTVNGNSYFGGNAAATSTVHIGGSLATAISTKVANYTLTTSDYTIIFDGTTLTATLPAANTCVGRIYVLVNRNVTSLTTSIAYQTFTTGVTSTTITAGSSVVLQSDGTNWYRIF
jgi:hypothetical protein